MNNCSLVSCACFGYENCWLHAALHLVAMMGFSKVPGLSGGENRSGGLFAKGTPRNLLTVAVAMGREVVVPITTPASIVTVGPPPG